MRCSHCGAALAESAGFCGSCGAAARAAAATSEPAPEWPPEVAPPDPRRAGVTLDTTLPLTLAIITTACCCLPFGIPAIVYAAQASGHVSSGNYANAEEAIRKSKMWSTIGIVVGGIVTLAYVGVIILGGLAR